MNMRLGPVPDQGSLSSGPRGRRESIRGPPTVGRVTVNETVYHQPADGGPTMVESKFSRWLESDDAPYTRPKAVAGPEWAPLDAGWVSECGMLMLKNLEGRFTQNVPTEYEREQASKMVIEVKLHPDDTGAILVRPGQSARFDPGDVRSVVLRCVFGQAKYTCTLVPR